MGKVLIYLQNLLKTAFQFLLHTEEIRPKKDDSAVAISNAAVQGSVYSFLEMQQLCAEHHLGGGNAPPPLTPGQLLPNSKQNSSFPPRCSKKKAAARKHLIKSS